MIDSMKETSSKQRPNGRPGSWVIFIVAVLLGIAAVIPFVESIYWDFVWDDLILIKNNERLDDPEHLKNIWLTDFFKETSSPGFSFFWRPLVKFSFWTDFQMHGRDPAGYHLTNLILYGVMIVLLFLFIYRFTSLPTSVITTLLFAWHPLRTEVVAWISSRTEIMVLLFGLASLLVLQKKRLCHRAIFALCLALALLSKESAILFPFLALIVIPEFTLKNRWFYAISTINLGSWFWLRRFSVGTAHWFPSALERSLRPAAALKSLVHYSKAHVWPVNLSTEPWFDFPKNWGEAGVVLGGVLLAVLIFLVIKFIRKDPPERLIASGAIWYLLCLTPFMHILPLPERAADRYANMASVGFILMIAGVLELLRRKPRIPRFCFNTTIIVLAIVSLIFAWTSFHLSPYWMSDQDIEYRAAMAGQSPQALLFLGKHSEMKGDMEGAYHAYLSALEREEKGSPVTLFSLAMASVETKRIDEAVKYLELCVEKDQNHGSAGMILGELYMQTGQYRKALRTMADQARRHPANPIPHLVTGQIYMDFLNQPAKAKAAFREALRRNPQGVQLEYIKDRMRKLQ